MMTDRFTFWDGLQLLLIWSRMIEVILWSWPLVLAPMIISLALKAIKAIAEAAKEG